MTSLGALSLHLCRGVAAFGRDQLEERALRDLLMHLHDAAWICVQVCDQLAMPLTELVVAETETGPDTDTDTGTDAVPRSPPHSAPSVPPSTPAPEPVRPAERHLHNELDWFFDEAPTVASAAPPAPAPTPTVIPSQSPPVPGPTLNIVEILLRRLCHGLQHASPEDWTLLDSSRTGSRDSYLAPPAELAMKALLALVPASMFPGPFSTRTQAASALKAAGFEESNEGTLTTEVDLTGVLVHRVIGPCRGRSEILAGAVLLRVPPTAKVGGLHQTLRRQLQHSQRRSRQERYRRHPHRQGGDHGCGTRNSGGNHSSATRHRGDGDKSYGDSEDGKGQSTDNVGCGSGAREGHSGSGDHHHHHPSLWSGSGDAFRAGHEADIHMVDHVVQKGVAILRGELPHAGSFPPPAKVKSV